MSFEGYYQLLCFQGHYWEMDVYTFDFSDDIRCPICNAIEVWTNMVDQTNESDVGRVELQILTPAEHCECPTCGNKHVKTAATYAIPPKSKMAIEYEKGGVRSD